MIVLTPPTVLQRIADVLEGAVLPDLNSSYAKGQAHAAVAMLRNVAALWADFARIYREDNDGLRRLLMRYLKLPAPMGEAAEGARRFRDRIVTTLGEIDFKDGDYEPLRAANLRLRALLDEMLVSLEARRDEPGARSLRKAVRAHLKAALSRESGGDSQSTMEKMSRGD